MLTFNTDEDYNVKTLPAKLTELNAAYDPERHLAVTVIFPTIQGEMPFAGMPAVFLRLAGCNRGAKVGTGCAFCFPSHYTTTVIPIEAAEENVILTTPEQQRRLFDIKIGDLLPSYSEYPAVGYELPMRTDITGITKRRVGMDELVFLQVQSTVDLTIQDLIVTKEHPFFVHANVDGTTGETQLASFKEAQNLLPFVDVLHGGAVKGYPGQINLLTLLQARFINSEEFDQLVRDQVEVRILDPESPSFNTDSIEVTSFTCGRADAYLFQGIYVHNCDTYFAVNETTTLYTIDALVQKLADEIEAHQMVQPLLVITGGEPMLQAPALAEFIPAILEAAIFERVQFETNGDLFKSPRVVDFINDMLDLNEEFIEAADDDEEGFPFVNFVISPKRTIKEPKNGAFMELCAQETGFYVRLVISGDPDSVYYTVPQFLVDGWDVDAFYLSPLTEYSNKPKDKEIADIRTDIDIEATRRNVARAIKLSTLLGLRVSLQAHSYIGIA